MRIREVLGAAAGALLLGATAARAQACDPRADTRATPPCLVEAFVNAMWEAHRTTLSSAVSDSPRRSAQQMVEDMLYATKQRHRGYVAALQAIGPYTENPAEAVQTAASLAVEALLMLDSRDSVIADAMKRMLDGTTSMTPSQQAEQQAEFRSVRRTAAEALVGAAGAIVMAIAETDSVSNRLTCRRLSSAQVRGNLAEIQRLFGKDLEAKANGQFSTDFAVAIRALRDSLRDTRWTACALRAASP